MRGQRHAPDAFYPRERLGTHCTAGWVDPRAALDMRGKSRLPPGFDPRSVQPVASRYTDWAIPAHIRITGSVLNSYRMPTIVRLVSNSKSTREDAAKNLVPPEVGAMISYIPSHPENSTVSTYYTKLNRISTTGDSTFWQHRLNKLNFLGYDTVSTGN